MDLSIVSLFDLSHTMAKEYLERFVYPWEALAGIGAFLEELSGGLGEGFREIQKGVFVHVSAEIAPTASFGAPCVVCAGTQVRSGAFVRGNALVGENCVVGNSTELKNCILFDNVEVPHFNYVGDSILGYRAHLGAGAVCANVRLDRGGIAVRGDTPIPTGRRKVGAFVGDGAQVGCNSVLAPGAVLGRGVKILPLTFVRGTASA